MICGVEDPASSWPRTRANTSVSSGMLYVSATSRSLFNSYHNVGYTLGATGHVIIFSKFVVIYIQVFMPPSQFVICR